MKVQYSRKKDFAGNEPIDVEQSIYCDDVYQSQSLELQKSSKN